MHMQYIFLIYPDGILFSRMCRFIAILICPEELEDPGEDAEVIPNRFEGSKDADRYRFLFK